jgi:RHS repeat-associated protein
VKGATEYLWFNGEPLAQIETATGAIDYYFNDHLGAPLLTTNSTGAVDWRVEREPYGSIFATRAGAERHQPLSLPGQEYDPNQPERAYNVFRWYRSSWGRYTQADPLYGLLIAEGLNPLMGGRTEDYAYARENPLRLVDRLGLIVGTGPLGGPGQGPCGYYDNICQQTGCDYPCKVAPKYCKSLGSVLNIFDSDDTKVCIRECLKNEDAKTRNSTMCPTCFTCGAGSRCINETCIANYHRKCFMGCGSNSWWPGVFPGAGPLFPGGGC